MRKAMLLFALIGLASYLWAADPFIGTWKMNAAMSKFSGMTPLKSFTIEYQMQNDGFNAVEEIVDANGKFTRRSYAGKDDGKDSAIKGDPTIDTISGKRPKPNIVEYVAKKNGEEVFRGRCVVSDDGKSYTDVGSGKTPDGQEFTYSIVFEKQ